MKEIKAYIRGPNRRFGSEGGIHRAARRRNHHGCQRKSPDKHPYGRGKRRGTLSITAMKSIGQLVVEQKPRLFELLGFAP